MKNLILAGLLLAACQPSIDVEFPTEKRATASVDPPCTLSASSGVETATPVVSTCRYLLAESFDPQRTTIDVYTSRPASVVTDVWILDGRSYVSITLWNEAGNATSMPYDFVVTEQ